MRPLSSISTSASPLLLPAILALAVGCGDDVEASATAGDSDSVSDTTTTGASGDTATSGTTDATATSGSDADSAGMTATSDDTTTTGDTGTTGGVSDSDTEGGTDPGECGDGVIDDGEACDDGNDVEGDGCEPDCTLSPPPDDCGNGQLDEGEECEGDMVPLAACSDLDEKYTAGDLKCAINCSYDLAACEVCEAPGQVLPCDAASDDVLHAMGLGCDSLGGDWSDANTHIPVANFEFKSNATTAYRVVRQFGTHKSGNTPTWGAKEGEKFLIISTGNLPEPDGDGVLTAAPGSAQTGNTQNNNPDEQTSLPGIMSHQRGSNNGVGGTPFLNCDGAGDCSDTLFAQWNLGTKTANDVIYFQFDVTVPKGTYGYNVDFAYFSVEYPEWVNTSFNDMAILWSSSETYTGNVTFITDLNDTPRPLTVTALAQSGLMKYTQNSPELANTGYDQQGGGTGWATVKGSAQPEETFTLAWTVFDKGDTVLDTALIIDNWRWDCMGCIPSEVDSCGIAPQ
ncbi:MAG: choice-of-anchor L domain-containing protein [Nannocystaceae bacterium]